MSNIYKTLQAFLVAIGGAYSSGQNLPGSIGLHEQAGIWISWCCRMFGIIKYPWNFSSESLCGERTGGGEGRLIFRWKSVVADYSYLIDKVATIICCWIRHYLIQCFAKRECAVPCSLRFCTGAGRTLFRRYLCDLIQTSSRKQALRIS